MLNENKDVNAFVNKGYHERFIIGTFNLKDQSFFRFNS